ncbi:hypothetical protein GCM10022254_37650 [Actinomadura meridiana]|uniref:Uncharacterized protein n=1 Tax=Actinomadura meridiana TaxID=559626 RepID=A0ABP8C5I0_9ACTN
MGEAQDQFDLLSAWVEGVGDAVRGGAMDELTLSEVASALDTLTDVIGHVTDLVAMVHERGTAVRESEKARRDQEWFAVTGIALLEVEHTGNMLIVAHHLSARAHSALTEVTGSKT